jgi:hypothetical protein
MSYITIDNLNSINAELSNYCNAACPMCARYDWNLDLVEGKVNNAYTKLEVFEEKIGKNLMANGYVSPCCYIGDLDQHEPKNIIKDYDKVNINKTSLHEILSGEFFRELENGIAGSYRLQSCAMTCGVN